MPRIEAPTVAEHSAMRRRQIVTAARDLLEEAGPSGLNPAHVAKRAGLARSSIYQYFASSDALLGAAVEAMLTATRDRVVAAVAGHTSPRSRIAAYVEVALADAARGHRTFPDFGHLQMPESCRAAIRQLHEEVARPIVDDLEDWGSDDPQLAFGLLVGAVNGAAAAVTHGADVETVSAATIRFVLDGLGMPRPEPEAVAAAEPA